MRKKYFFSWIVVFLLCLPVVGRTQVNIDEEHFPDAEFREYVKTNFDKDSNGILSEEECAAVTSVRVVGMEGLSSVKGIEHFPNLTDLSCYRSGIKSLDVSQNPDLFNLDCSETKIESLDVSHNPALNSLECYNTGIKNLDVSKNLDLQRLYCYNTGITSLDLSQNSELWDLQCSNTGREVAVGVGETYDLESLPGFDVSRASQWQGGSVEGSVLTFNSATVTYEYSTGYTGRDDVPEFLPFRLVANPALVAMPVEFSPASGTIVKKGDIIRLNCANESAVIYYGLGKDAEPTLEYNPEEGIVISQDTAYVTARSIVAGEDTSEITSAVYRVYSIPIDEEHFPDPAFREYVSGFEIDRDGSGDLDLEECSEVKYLHIFSEELTSLKGMEYFPNLRNLECSRAKITSLDLSQNPNLEYLRCSDAGIKSLDVSHNPKLVSLSCANTEITSLDVSHNPDLADLECFGTDIDSLDVSHNPKLQSLICNDTRITSLDVSQNTDLRVLFCYNTDLTHLDVSHNPNLLQLQCANTKITSLDLSQNLQLFDLNCSDTEITHLDVSRNLELMSLFCSNTGIGSLDVRHLSGLQNLRFSNTGLSNIDVSHNPALGVLGFSGTRLSSIDVSHNPSLYVLDFSNTRLSSIDVSHNPSLTYLYDSNARREVAIEVGGSYDLNRLPGFDVSRAKDWKGGNVEGTILTFQDTAVTYQYATGSVGKEYVADYVTFRLVANPSLIAKPVEFNPASGSIVKMGDTIRLNCATEEAIIYYGLGEDAEPELEYNPEKGIVISQDITYVTARSIVAGEDTSEITSAIYQVYLIPIDEEHFPNERFRNYVKDFDKDGSGTLNEEECAAVTEISLYYSYSLTSLEGIEYFPNLEKLICRNSALTSLDVSRNPALRHLECSETEIPSLDVSRNLELEYLRCSSMMISSLDVSQNPELEYLDCSFNEIPSLDLSQNPGLASLYCYHTGLTSLDVSHNPALITLDCSNTGITSLDVNQNAELKSLICSETGIAGLDLSHNPVLSSLYCYNTAVKSLDLSQNPELVHLNCNNTGITRLDVSQNLGLELLHCANTGITNLDVSKNTALRDLDCSSTDILSLDVSQNLELDHLNCYNTALTSLDLSHNARLMMLYCDNLSRALAVEVGGTYDLSRLPGFEVSRAGSWKGGSVEGTVLTFHDTVVTYRYATGLTEGWREYDSLDFRLVANPALIVEPVEFSPASGSIVKMGDTVRLSCASEGANIYYGLGEEAEPDQEYKPAEGIVITADTTHVTALAMIAGHDTSEVVSAVYYVKVEEPEPEPEPGPDTIQVVLPSGLEAGVEGDAVSLSWKSEEDHIYEVKVEGPGEQDSLTREVASAGERTGYRFTGLEKGTYRWSVRVIGVGETDTVSTYVEGEEFKIGEVSSRKEELAGVRIYPNPSAGNFKVEVKEAVRLDIYTVTGVRVKSLDLGAGTESLELKVSGLYLMRFTAADGRIGYRRLLVR